jgi:spermidine/putrescine transport system ATP-binding protein
VRIANGLEVPVAVPDGVEPGDTVNLSVRPEKIAVDEEVEEGMISLDATVETHVYLGVMTQITVSLGDGAQLVALEQAWHRARAEERWEPGMKITIGWRPEHCRVLR